MVSGLLFRDNEVLADDVGLLVRHRGRLVRSYRWDQIREAGLGYGSGMGWRGIIVFPDGGPNDVPGPNSPYPRRYGLAVANVQGGARTHRGGAVQARRHRPRQRGAGGQAICSGSQRPMT